MLEVINKKMEMKYIAIALVATLGLSVIAVAMDTYAPNGRRWPVTTGMHLPLVTIIDENGYYANLACTVTSFNNDAHTYNLACGDAPAYITVNQK